MRRRQGGYMNRLGLWAIAGSNMSGNESFALLMPGSENGDGRDRNGHASATDCVTVGKEVAPADTCPRVALSSDAIAEGNNSRAGSVQRRLDAR